MSQLLANVTAAPALDSRHPDPWKSNWEKLRGAFVATLHHGVVLSKHLKNHQQLWRCLAQDLRAQSSDFQQMFDWFHYAHVEVHGAIAR